MQTNNIHDKYKTNRDLKRYWTAQCTYAAILQTVGQPESFSRKFSLLPKRYKRHVQLESDQDSEYEASWVDAGDHFDVFMRFEDVLNKQRDAVTEYLWVLGQRENVPGKSRETSMHSDEFSATWNWPNCLISIAFDARGMHCK